MSQAKGAGLQVEKAVDVVAHGTNPANVWAFQKQRDPNV